MEKTSTEVMSFRERHPIIDPQTNEGVMATSRANLGTNRGVQVSDLDPIKVPTGGSLNFEVPDLEGARSAKYLSGFITAWRDARVYHSTPYGEGSTNKQPDCKSLDGVVGIGDPGGSCDSCPLAQFGSDPKGGRGQACKQIRQLLFLREGEIVPNRINIPPTSLKSARQYFLRLLSGRIPHWAIVTNLSLERAVNEGGIQYARVLFSSGQKLNPEEREMMRPFAEQMDSLLKPLDLGADDYEVQSEQDDTPRE